MLHLVSDRMRRRSIQSSRILVPAFALLLAACAQAPMAPSETHIRAEPVARDEGSIPPPVQMIPVLPKPSPAVKPETYSVVVSNVRVQDLLFALARDAKVNIDIHPSVEGTVTLNAIDQTLTQLLSRLSRQVDMRYELDGQNLIVTRDTPFLRIYRIDYVNLARETESKNAISSQISGGVAGSSGGGGAAANTSTSTVSSKSLNKFWDTLIANIKDILRETDRVLPAEAAAPAQAPAAPPPAAPGTAGAGATPAAAAAPAQPAATFREAASVIANAETGVLSIRATARQHEKVQEFLDQVMTNARRQVLIEATVAEVQLNNQYQQGIDWQRLRTGALATGTAGFGTGSSGLEFGQSSANTPAGINTTAFVLGGALRSLNFSAAIKFLESFGDVRVLSSPKLSVLNNQSAILKVVDNLVYFTVQATTTASANAPAVTTFNTTAHTVPVGLVMTVVPQISDTQTVSLNVRPSISRLIRYVADPNPSLGAVANQIPEIQTREMESVLRVQNGEIAVLGGLIEDRASNVEDGIPGVRNVPGIGALLSQRRDENRKTELVIFLRPTVIRDASIDGDYRALRSLLPDDDYLRRPNPGKLQPAAPVELPNR